MRSNTFRIVSILSFIIATGALCPVLAQSPTPVPLTDDVLEDRVRAALDRDPELRDSRIDIDAADGFVTLSGTVQVMSQSLEAQELTADVKGVLTVDNRIRIGGSGRSDSDIAFDVRKRFSDNGDLVRSGIDVRVVGGTVLLTGAVDDARVRFVARQVASQVPGVIGITDGLQGPTTDDALVLQRVREILMPGSLAGGIGQIEPTVAGGVVTLAGSVATPRHRIEAETRVLGVNGVRSVINLVEIRPQ